MRGLSFGPFAAPYFFVDNWTPKTRTSNGTLEQLLKAKEVEGNQKESKEIKRNRKKSKEIQRNPAEKKIY